MKGLLSIKSIIFALSLSVAGCGCIDDEYTPPLYEYSEENILFESDDRDGNGVNEVNITKVYGLVSDGSINQSEIVQNAIDAISESGGGELYFPDGVYSFADILMKSNVRILVSSGATLKLFYEEGQLRPNMFVFSPKYMNDTSDFIENCSIESVDGEQYTVDYSFANQELDNTGGRFVYLQQVRNFVVADAMILDNYTWLSAITTAAVDNEDVEGWEVVAPMDGTVRNCSVYNAHGGFGLIQLQAGRRVHFEDLFGHKGITLRCETGSAGINGGIFDITAKNIRGERCNAVVMLNPHGTVNGRVDFDGIYAENCSFAVLVKPGYLDDRYDYVTEAGCYEDHSTISNVYAIYGTTAQIDKKNAWLLDDEDQALVTLSSLYQTDESFVGPSIAAVFDSTSESESDESKKGYIVDFSNVESEGFKEHASGVLCYNDEYVQAKWGTRWSVINAILERCNALLISKL